MNMKIKKTMNIYELKDADLNLVTQNKSWCERLTPHCKFHGAMNKVTKEGIWRCLVLECNAGCQEEDLNEDYSNVVKRCIEEYDLKKKNGVEKK